MKYDVFVSYSRKDTKKVDEFVSRLEAEGFRVWIDRDGVESGDAFKRVIVKAIKESAVFMFFSSESSNSSIWTTKEVSIAVHYEKPIIPIKIDKSVYNEDVEFDLVNLDYIDYTDESMQQSMMEKLIRTMKSRLPERWKEICAAKSAESVNEKHEVIQNQVEESPKETKKEPLGINRKEETVVSGQSAQQPAKSKGKSALWIAIAAVALAVIAALFFFLKPSEKQKEYPVVVDLSDLTVSVNGVQFVMKPVEGEPFVMGGTNENPAHKDSVSTFYLGETEVTQALWKAVMGSDPTYNDGWTAESGIGDNYPAYEVSWNDIQKFLHKLNALTNRNFRLPTEVEWEFAARGGKKANGYLYSGSNHIDDVAWYNKNSGNATHEVKQLKSNELGLYDMSGNVWEWCCDLYAADAENASMRVLRGGGWNRNADRCQVIFRGKGGPDFRGNSHGFRLALSM